MAELKIIPADGPVGYKTIPTNAPLLVGAGTHCDVRVKGSGIRDEHCRIGFKRGAYYIEAIEGAREIKLNGAKVEVAKLKADDDISIGKHRFVLKLKPEEEEKLAKAAEAAVSKKAAAYYVPFYKNRLFQIIAGSLVVLSALAVWLYFDYRRSSAEKAFKAAQDEFAAGAFPQAMKSFEKFEQDFASNPMVNLAKFYRGFAAVRQYSDGAAPSYKQALEAVKSFVADYQKTPAFAEQSKDVADTVARIGVGLATAAEKIPDQDSLDKATDAVGLIDAAFSRADRPEDKLTQIQTLIAGAKLAIEKDARKRQSLAVVNRLLAEKNPIQLYREHQKLYRAYPDLKTDRAFVELRKKAGEIEREQVVFETAREGSTPMAAKPTEAPARTTVQRRAAPTAKKTGNVMAVQVADAIYALDVGNGEVLWRQVVGFEPAFAPMVVKGRGILLHAPAEGALALVEPATGKSIWRQATKAYAPQWSSQPLVQGANVYFYALDAEKSDKGNMVVHRMDDGKAVGRYIFPQRLAGSPSFQSDRQAILVVGQQVSLYSIQPSTRQCDSVVVLDHEAESVHCAPVFKGDFLFLAEEVKAEQSRLRCLVLGDGKAEARMKQTIENLRGAIWNEPYVNFGKLALATDLNRFMVFDINDAKDAVALTEVLQSAAVLESKVPPAMPYLPNDKEFWTIGAKLSAYALGAGAQATLATWDMPLDGPPISPPQQDGTLVAIATRAAGSGTVGVYGIDSSTRKEVWKTVLGKQPGAAAIDPSDAKTLLVTFADETKRLQARDFAADRVVEAVLPPDPLVAQRDRKSIAWKPIREWTEGVLQWPGVNGRVLAYFPPTGNRVEYPLRSAIASRPSMLGKSILVPTVDGLLYSIDPKTGAETADPYVGPYSKDGQPTPMGPLAALNERTVIAVAGQRIVRLELSTAATPADFRENGAVDVAAGPIEHMIGIGGQLLLTYGREIALLDPAQMRLTKKWPIQSAIGREPIALANTVLFMADGGELLCVGEGPKGIDLRWQLKLEGEPAGVTAAGNVAWVAYAHGALQRVDLATGKASAGPSFGRFIVDGPWVPGDRIIGLTPDGSFASVAAGSGE